jgi:hypothetical protein
LVDGDLRHPPRLPAGGAGRPGGAIRATRDDVWETREFHCRRLSEDIYLPTYTLLQDNQRLTRLAAIWRSTAEGWKIVYHQGTIEQDA